MKREAIAHESPRAAGFLRRQQVAFELGVTRHTLRRIIQSDPAFPRFFEISPGVEVIERRDLDRWIRLKKLLAGRSAPT